ncbi:NAD(P)/FAD-dependent oxidoreductase [Psychroflexus sp. YR1-1]|uniref:NAD(P)/FAD-dependent oxidoreductase n=1 Tax=Psychroflexus aurantiacus TaxID=2709310 RepID=A0A6B3R623_9FLAO|nr:NAD(P)/FAD-dependent oxidoreductase [Psychroflexus aurantiacus]NEV94535.1 NAD(P)/FAD-dependent oxidoreductase [Psychroflexus aurantiacus]
MKVLEREVVIIGGGAAGFFAGINLAAFNSEVNVLILEKSKQVLSKVKISGGGRCNVTHAEFDPMALAKNYPRGHKELLGPFHQFMTGDMFAWLEERGVELKVENDQRVFPVSDSSQTIIDCFEAEASRVGVEVRIKAGVDEIYKREGQDFSWELKGNEVHVFAKTLIFASGSSPKLWRLIQSLGHRVIEPVPSLFTFNVKDKRIEGLSGISLEAEVQVFTTKDRGVSKQKLKSLHSSGPILITHWGLSGPCILKLSAWGARVFHELNHQFQMRVNWLPHHHVESLQSLMETLKTAHPKQLIYSNPIEALPKRLWQSLLDHVAIDSHLNWSNISKTQIHALAVEICAGEFHVNGKSTFKDEFVTSGGVDLREIDFKTFGSKLHDNLYFVGEVLDIDAVTGGFNFQNAWTGAYICAKHLSKSL